MGEEEEEEKNPNPKYIVADLVEAIILRLPLKSIFKLKTVLKQWRSTLESRSFAEKRMSFQKNHKIMSAIEIESEIEMVYLQCDDSITRYKFTCDGLVCVPQLVWVYVYLSTGGFLKFLSIPCTYRVMGFGRNEVNGSYKLLRMLFDPDRWHILDVKIGGYWRKLNPPPYTIEPTTKSACVNGSIYWLNVDKILALDLQTEEFRDVRYRYRIGYPMLLDESQIPNMLLTSTLVSLSIFE